MMSLGVAVLMRRIRNGAELLTDNGPYAILIWIEMLAAEKETDAKES